MSDSAWWVYIIECDDGALYTGITTDLLRRWSQHNQGQGAKYFRTRKPKAFVYQEACSNRSEASRREYQIKQLSRKEKLCLIQRT